MKTKKTIKAEIEEVEHEIVMENARHSDESLRLTRLLRELEEELDKQENEEAKSEEAKITEKIRKASKLLRPMQATTS
jgi:hypothetical protein